MAEQSGYRLLLLTSDPFSVTEITEIAERHFRDPTVVFWAQGDMSTKAAVLQRIEATDYDVIISYINGIVLKRHHLARARFGAINIHPAPPEHGGVWGLWCQPVILRDVRTHHGVTLHEIDEEIDHGVIYQVERWEVDPDATIQSVAQRAFQECFHLLTSAAAQLASSPHGTRTFTATDERWDPTNRHHTVHDVRQWFAALDPDHPAHAERVPFNHPRGTCSPPYFDDLPPWWPVTARLRQIRWRLRLRTRVRHIFNRPSRPA